MESSELGLPGPGGHQQQVGVLADTGAVCSQIGAFGDHVESGKQRDAFVKYQVHDVTLAFLTDEFESQQGAHGLLSGNHVGSGQIHAAQHLAQIQVAHQRDEEEQSASLSPERSRSRTQFAHIGNGGSLSLERGGPLLVAAGRKPRETFLAQQHRQRIDADGMARAGEIAFDVIDGEIFLAHGHSQLPDSVARGCFLRATLDWLEKPGALCGIVAGLMTEDAKSAGRVIETAGGLLRRHVFNEIAAKRFVLAMRGIFGREKEIRLGRSRYPLSSTDSHSMIMLYSGLRVKYIVRLGWKRRNVLYAFSAMNKRTIAPQSA